ncbi:hypothetical protein CAPTEDRAFT_224315 [Capitella teleta]|uniref:Fringe-like glycosyltransferase domain-containing protein n=1 Tax=Capitella teleta TaxID=283909 RepID=R7U573_CAPTE|nr:hypothetical protein CAPTEDRAFT_224315 [Capitella teleta]|eukprot:ELU01276.1 hypothetical protein CAPTEDRAFT_224315 [Capitella teleta]
MTTYFFTDEEDEEFSKRTKGHLINTNCTAGHTRRCVVKWRWSTIRLLPQRKGHPLQMGDKENPGQKIAFWFATGGAGFCISRGLALKMMPHTSGGRLKTVCEHIRLPDDCSIGYIISFKLKKELTIVKDFHSHLEGLWKINHRNIEDQITMSYMCMSSGASSKPSPSRNGCNSVDISSGFPPHVDPTRFLSIHCLLYPNLAMCQEIS